MLKLKKNNVTLSPNQTYIINQDNVVKVILSAPTIDAEIDDSILVTNTSNYTLDAPQNTCFKNLKIKNISTSNLLRVTFYTIEI
jgi:hypothetical protein